MIYCISYLLDLSCRLIDISRLTDIRNLDYTNSLLKKLPFDMLDDYLSNGKVRISFYDAEIHPTLR